MAPGTLEISASRRCASHMASPVKSEWCIVRVFDRESGGGTTRKGGAKRRDFSAYFQIRLRICSKSSAIMPVSSTHAGPDDRPASFSRKVRNHMRTPIAVAALLASAGLGASVAAVAVHEADGGAGTTIIRRPAVTVNAAPAASTSPSGGMSVSEIYRKSVPGVVEVLSTGQTSGSGFFGGQTESAQGTGFQVDTKGDIVTNYHVVENSDSVQVGDSVVAIGDPYGLRNTATAGIVSALHRTIVSPSNDKITGVIQTDAAINSGNSGGPLLNSQGQVIGVNSQIESGSQNGGGGGNIGIGFSIPSNTVASVAHSLIETAKSKPYVGIVLVTVTPSVANATGMSAGVEIVSVTKGAPGDTAGLQGATGTKT